MERIVEMITSGSSEFTPSVMVGLIVFVMIIDCIGSIASSLFKGVR